MCRSWAGDALETTLGDDAERLIHSLLDPMNRTGLGDVSVGAVGENLLLGIEGAIPGDDDHRNPWELRLDLLHELHAVHDWHVQVRDDEIGDLVAKIVQRAFPAFDRERHMAHDLEKIGQHLPHAFLIIDDKNAFAGHAFGALGDAARLVSIGKMRKSLKCADGRGW